MADSIKIKIETVTEKLDQIETVTEKLDQIETVTEKLDQIEKATGELLKLKTAAVGISEIAKTGIVFGFAEDLAKKALPVMGHPHAGGEI